MKKVILLVLFTMILVSCSEDFTSNDNKEFVSTDQLQDLAASSPESFLIVGNALDTGSNSYLKDWNQTDAGMHDDFGQMAINLGLDLMASDMVQVTYHWFGRYYRYDGRTEVSRITYQVWFFYYNVIRNANETLDFIPETTTDPTVLQIKGRALALRGWAYFNLIRIYQQANPADGDAAVPLYLTTLDASGKARATAGEVKSQILSDLTDAYSLLNGYSRSSKEAIDQNVVAGILARYHLEYGNYSDAVIMAQQAKSAGSLGNILDGFDEISNTGWLWGGDIDSETSTIYASFFSHIGTQNQGYAGLLGSYKSIDASLYDKISDTDTRKNWFLSTYENVKFVDDTFFEGDYVYMRVAEMYLIEAEAQALNGNDTAAAQVLYDLVSTRDTGYALSSSTGTDLLDEIRTHRAIELWGEGFSWFDMKRWGTGVTRDYTGSNHAGFGFYNFSSTANEMVFQIPDDELNVNPLINVEDQNPL